MSLSWAARYFLFFSWAEATVESTCSYTPTNFPEILLSLKLLNISSNSLSLMTLTDDSYDDRLVPPPGPESAELINYLLAAFPCTEFIEGGSFCPDVCCLACSPIFTSRMPSLCYVPSKGAALSESLMALLA